MQVMSYEVDSVDWTWVKLGVDTPVCEPYEVPGPLILD
jgi:hypothetical protein